MSYLIGALLGTMNRKTEEVYWLTDALRINPNLTHALINLGEGFLDYISTTSTSYLLVLTTTL